MNKVEIESQSIEFVFENCEAIHVDVWAIENLYLKLVEKDLHLTPTEKTY